MAAPKSKTAAAGTGDMPTNDQVNDQATAPQTNTASDQKVGADAAATTSEQPDVQVTTSSQSTASDDAAGSAAASTDVKLVDAIEVKTVFGLNSFWRSGIKFGQEAKTILLQDLTEVQLEAIKLEENLIHKLVQVEQAIKDVI